MAIIMAIQKNRAQLTGLLSIEKSDIKATLFMLNSIING